MKVVVKIDELCQARGIKQYELAAKAGVLPGALSEMKKRSVLNKELIAKIATALELTDIRELVDLVPD